MLESFDRYGSLTIRSSEDNYGVTIGADCVRQFLEARRGATLIADARFADALRAEGHTVIAVNAVETEKTLDIAAAVIEQLRGNAFGRSDRIVAVGGGIVQDVACFIASVYMRGVSWDYCPTTLLGMTDSCIGAKSSINVGRFKNIVGTYHAPDYVLVDVDYVETLLPQQVVGGLCEAVKICFARSETAFVRYLAAKPDHTMQGENLAHLIHHSLSCKKWFIEIDEFDQNERLNLNFGHTFGHAIEAATKFSIEHGIAVGLGVLCAIYFARSQGEALAPRTDELEAHILTLLRGVYEEALGCPIERNAFRQAFLSDKKHSPDYLALILPVGDALTPLQRVRLPRNDATLRAVDAACDQALQAVALGKHKSGRAAAA